MENKNFKNNLTDSTQEIDKNRLAMLNILEDLKSEIERRKISEEILRNSEERYRTLFNCMPLGIGIGNFSGEILDANPAMCRILGYTLDEFRKINTADTYMYQEDRETVWAEMNLNKCVQDHELILKKKDQSGFDALLNINLIDIEDKQLIMTTIQDISVQKRVELEIIRQKDFFEQMFIQSSVSTQILDKDGWCERINSKLSEIFGVEAEQMEGKVYNIFKDQEIIDNGIIHHLDQVFKEGKTAEWEVHFDIGVAAESQNIRVKENKKVWYDNWAYPIFDENNNLNHVIIQHNDITNRKNAESDLIESEKLFREILENLQEGYYKCTQEGIIIYHNPSFAEMLGYDRSVLLTGTSILTHWKDPRERGKYLEALNSQKKVNNYSIILNKTNGQPITILLNSHLARDIGSNTTIIEGSIIDISERIKAQEKIAESENRYNSFVNASVDIIFIKDENLKHLMVNDAACNFFQLRQEEIIGKSDYEILDKSVADICYQSDIDALNARKVIVTQEHIGEAFFETTKFPLQLSSNRTGIGAIIRNITDKILNQKIQEILYKVLDGMVTSKTTDEVLELVRQSLGEVIDTSNFFIAMYDQKNDLMNKLIWRDEKDEFTQWKASDSITGLVVKKGTSLLANREQIFRLAEENKIQLMGTVSECWLGVPLRLEKRVTGALVVQSYTDPRAYDERIQNMLEIIANELSVFLDKKRISDETIKLLKAIVQSPVSIVITNTEGVIEYVNPKFTEVTGYTYEESQAKNPRILKSGHHDTSFYKDLWQTIRAGKDWQGEFLNKRKNGELFWENAIISPIHNEKGEITHFIGIKEDITNKKILMDELINAKEKAEESDRLKSYFLANMSHELRTPMTGILGFSEMITEVSEESETKRLAQFILESGHRLLDTLNLILDLSKIEAEHEEIILTHFDLNGLIQSIISNYSLVAQKKGIELFAKLEPGNLMMQSNERMISSILHNLVNNAIKYTEKGTVEVIVRSNAGRVNIEVKDTGIGIPSDYLEVIFDDFRQVSEGYGRNFEGTGLGLSITRKFVEKLNGSINVQSTPGSGSTFIVSLPYTSSQAIPETRQVISSNPEPVKSVNPDKDERKKILIVEDDQTNQDYLVLSLNPIYDTETAVDGETALTLARLNHYDAIMLDINLGIGMTGTEVITELRKRNLQPGTPVIAVTAYAMKGDAEKYLSQGFDAYLSKPYHKSEILKILKELL